MTEVKDSPTLRPFRSHADLAGMPQWHGEADPVQTVTRAVLRSWPVILLSCVVAVGASVAYSRTRPVEYQAAASLAVASTGYSQVIAGGYTAVDATRRLQTGADLMSLPALRQRVVARLRGVGVSPEQLSSVRPLFGTDSDVLRVVAVAKRPQAAAALANATATEFLSFRNELAAQRLTDTRRLLRKQERSASTRVDRRALEAKLNNLAALKTLDDSQFQLVQQALPPAAAVPVRTLRNAAIALCLGLIVGLAFGLLRGPRARATPGPAPGGTPPSSPSM